MSHSYLSPPSTHTQSRSLIAFAVLAALAGAPEVRAAGETSLISFAPDGSAGDNRSWSWPSAISSDGRLVVFTSTATNLVPDDANGKEDAFVHDRLTGQTTRVSVASDGTEGSGDTCDAYGYGCGSRAAGLSADGRYVTFHSYASNLVPDDANGKLDVFVHDRQTRQTSRISVASNGAEADDDSSSPSISADGRYVAFDSYASNLVPGDTNGKYDVFVHDRQAKQTTRVSVATDGSEGSGDTCDAYGNGCGSVSPSISPDGRYVAFASHASNLVAGDTNGMEDVFVRDRQSGQTTRASVASNGAEGDSSSDGEVSISADGRFVAFDSYASNLVPGDTNDTYDVFVHDRQTRQTTRVSVASDGTEANTGTGSFVYGLSADGRYVTFYSYADNLVAGDTNGSYDAFVHDRQTKQTTRISVDSNGAEANGDSEWPVPSADGRYVAFSSKATNLVSNPDANDNWDVFVHDRLLLPAKTADLDVRQKVSPKPVSAGMTLTYTIKVKNNGTDDATNVAVTDILPDAKHATLLSVTSGKGGSCRKAPITVCRFGTIKAGATANVVVKVKPLASGKITNSVSANAAPTEPTPEDNANSLTTTVR